MKRIAINITSSIDLNKLVIVNERITKLHSQNRLRKSKWNFEDFLNTNNTIFRNLMESLDVNITSKYRLLKYSELVKESAQCCERYYKAYFQYIDLISKEMTLAEEEEYWKDPNNTGDRTTFEEQRIQAVSELNKIAKIALDITDNLKGMTEYTINGEQTRAGYVVLNLYYFISWPFRNIAKILSFIIYWSAFLLPALYAFATYYDQIEKTPLFYIVLRQAEKLGFPILRDVWISMGAAATPKTFTKTGAIGEEPHWLTNTIYEFFSWGVWGFTGLGFKLSYFIKEIRALLESFLPSIFSTIIETALSGDQILEPEKKYGLISFLTPFSTLLFTGSLVILFGGIGLTWPGVIAAFFFKVIGYVINLPAWSEMLKDFQHASMHTKLTRSNKGYEKVIKKFEKTSLKHVAKDKDQ